MKNRKWHGRAGALALAAAMSVQALPAAFFDVLAEQPAAKEITQGEHNVIEAAEQRVPVVVVDGSERSANFNTGWRFALNEKGNCQSEGYDDSAWEMVNLPHDYSLSQDYDRNLEGESGFKPGGLGWYRKTFTLDPSLKGKSVRIDFDGVYMNSEVFINGHKLGEHPYGYTPFSFDLSDWLDFEGENTIAVKVDHRTPSSRWYSGSGIYRDVHLTVTDNVHVGLFGTAIDTDLAQLDNYQGGEVASTVRTTVENGSDAERTVSVRHTLLEKSTGQEVAAGAQENVQIAAGESLESSVQIKASGLTLWSVKNPFLYTVHTEIVENGETVDAYDTEYGYRTFHFDPDTGFSLNGEDMKLNGVCMHHDQGSLGAVASRAAITRQVEKLQAMGVNAIRVTHNPASQVLLDVCNEKGVLVIEEFFDTWANPKNGNTEDYSNYFNAAIGEDNTIEYGQDAATWAQFDLQSTIRRGYNSPAIIMWSLGNEIQHGNVSQYPTYAGQLIGWVKELDPVRPVTLGDNRMLGNDDSVAINIREQIAAAGGVIGSNYGRPSYINTQYRSKHPDWSFYGSENVSAINSRGVYDRIGNGTMASDLLLTSYDYSCVSWGHTASDSMLGVVQNDFMSGQFVWTGFDYIGEPTPWNGINPDPNVQWPAPKNSYFGIIDTAGFEKDTFYFYQSQWRRDITTLHVLPAWREDVIYKDYSGNTPVVVYSNAAAVELIHTAPDGTTKSYGKRTFTKHTTANGYEYQLYEGEGKQSAQHRNLYLTWNIPYEDGKLTAIAYDEQGHVIEETSGRKEVANFGDAAQMKVDVSKQTLQADGSDLSYLEVSLFDENGVEAANANNRVTFKVEGEGFLAGVDNGHQSDHQSYQDDNRKAFSGKVLGIVQSTKKAGPITVTISAEGMEDQVITLNSVNGQEAADDEIVALTYSRSCYMKAGTMPDLPAQVLAEYGNGETGMIDAEWDALDPADLLQTGTVIAHGKAGGVPVQIALNVIDKIGALQNYSAAVPVGSLPDLPSARPIIMPDGSTLSAEFPVSWDALNEEDFQSEGTVVVHGSASVFGEVFDVTATLRVAGVETVAGPNCMPQVFAIEQNIPEQYWSDTLDAIKDGATALGKVSGGIPNPTVWSNYKWSSAEAGSNKTSTLTMSLDTQQLIGQAVIWFGDDAWCMSYPDAGTTKIEVSADKETWTEVEATETIGDISSNARPYTYDFASPVRALYVRVTVTNANKSTPEGFTCTGITELQLNTVVQSQVVHSDAALASLKINGSEVNVENASMAKTPAWIAEIEAVGKNNASVTVLPVYEDVIRLLIESEDHSRTTVFPIYLKQPDAPDAEDDSKDYPTSMLTAKATSEYSGSSVEGPARFVLDNNPGTYYHTNWNTSEGSQEAHRHVDLIFDEPQLVGTLRYLPRNTSGSGGQNGRIIEYRISYQAEENGEWIDLTTGTWEATVGWKAASFRPVNAKAVRLTGVRTMSNGSIANTDMSASELRLAAPQDTKDLSALEGLEISVPEKITVDSVDADHPVTIDDQIVLAENGKTLRYGMDYYVTYRDNDKAGTATAVITGICDYSGTIERTFAIELADAPVQSADKRLLARASAYAHAAMEEEGYDKVNGLVRERLEAALAAADALLADENASQQDVDAAWTELTGAIHMLGFTSDKSELQALMVQADEINASLDLYEGDLDAFRTAYAAAKETLASDTALDERITKCLNDLQQAISGLRRKDEQPLDTRLLELVLSETEKTMAELDRYIEEGKPAFTAAYEAGRTALASAKGQEEIDAAASALNDAWLRLRLRADEEVLRALQDFVNIASNIDRKAYSARQLSVIDNAIHTIEKALSDHRNKAPELSEDAGNALLAVMDGAMQEMRDPQNKIIGSTISADRLQLQALVSQLKGLRAGDYTDASWKPFDAARSKAMDLLADENSSQKDLIAAFEQLDAARNALCRAGEQSVQKAASTRTAAASQTGWFAALGAAALGMLAALGKKRR